MFPGEMVRTLPQYLEAEEAALLRALAGVEEMSEMDSFEWMKAEGFFEDQAIANAVKRMRPDLKRVEALRGKAEEMGLKPDSPITLDFFLEAMDTYVQFLVSHRYVMKALVERTVREESGIDRETH